MEATEIRDVSYVGGWKGVVSATRGREKVWRWWQPVEGKGIQLEAPLKMSLERAIEYIDADEFVEATPKSLRLRKRILDARRDRAKASGIKRGLVFA